MYVFVFVDGPNSQKYILETITMTTVSERRVMREAEENVRVESPGVPNLPSGGSPISGILKGGRLWKQGSLETNSSRNVEPQQVSDNQINRFSILYLNSEIAHH